MKRLNSVREFLIQYYQEQTIHLGGLLEQKSKEFKKTYVPQIIVKKVPLPVEEKILYSDFKNREKKQDQKPNSKLIKFEEIASEDFFNQNLKPQIIVITGESGLGKTSYCQNLLKQWSQNQLWKEKFDEVIYLSMQKLIFLPEKFLGDGHSLEEILNNEFPNDFVQKIYPTLQKKLQESPNRILLILEGYDEKPIRSDLEKSIDALFDKFPQVLITSRPGYFTKYNNTFLELCSFTENQIENYLNTVNQKKLINFLKINPNLKNLAKIPALLEMIYDIWADDGQEIEQVQTLTQLYVKIIEKVEKRLTKELHEKNPSIKSPESKAREVLEVLEQLAFISMHQYIKGSVLQAHLKLILDKNYLYNSQKENIRNLLLRTGLIRCTASDYSFAHPSFQEFFAARYLSRIFNMHLEHQDPLIIQWLPTQKYQRFYQQMLIFLSNLLVGTNWSNFLKKMVKESLNRTDLHHNLLYMRLLKEKDWNSIEFEPHFQKIQSLFKELVNNINDPNDEDGIFSLTCTLIHQNPKWGIQILKNLIMDEKEDFFIKEETIKILTSVTPEFLTSADAQCIIQLLSDEPITTIEKMKIEGVMGSRKIRQYHYLRSVAARGLGIIGSEMASKKILLALIKLLLSNYADRDEIDQALWSIEQIALAKTTSDAIREVIPILIDKLQRSDTIDRQRLIRALGCLGSKFVNDVSHRIVEPLHSALSDDTTKEFAIEALIKLNPAVINDQVIDALFNILKEDYNLPPYLILKESLNLTYIEDIGLIIGRCAQAGVLKDEIKKNISVLIAWLSPPRTYSFYYQRDYLEKTKRGREIITWALSHLTPDAINDKSAITRRNQYNNHFYRPKSIHECLIAFSSETASKKLPIPALLPLSVVLSKASPPIPEEFKGDYELKLMRQEIFNHDDFSKKNYLASSIGIPCCTFLRLFTTSPYHDSGTESPELANTYYRGDRSFNTRSIGRENFSFQTKNRGKKKLKGADHRHLGEWHHYEEALKLRSQSVKEQKNDDRGDGHLYNALLNYKNEICEYIVNSYYFNSSRPTSTIVPGFYNEYPCVMVYTPFVLETTSKLTLTTKKSWTVVIMCFFTGLMNFIAFKRENLPLELVIRPSFSFFTPTMSETGESFRLSVGIIPEAYADVLVKGLMILNGVLTNLKTTPKKFDQKLPDDIYLYTPEYQTYFGQNKTQSPTLPKTILSLLAGKVEKDNSGKSAITNLVRTFAMQAALIMHFYQKLCQATNLDLDNQVYTHLFVETLGWGLNHAAVNKTHLSIEPPELQKIMIEPLSKSKEINEQKFWELIKNISKTLSQGLTTEYSLELAKRVKESGHRLNTKILKLAETKKIDQLYYNLEKLNELIHVQSIIEPYGDESDSYGSESDQGEDETNIYRKKIIVENGMASIIGACQGAIYHCAKMASPEKEHAKILTYKLYFESKYAWKLLKLNPQVKEIKDFLEKIEKNRTTNKREADILMLDSNPVITDGKECQPPLEIAINTLSNKVLIVDSTSSTLETYQKWVGLFKNKDHIEILMFVSSGLKNEQVCADNNPYGTIRVFARQVRALNDVLDYIKSVKRPIRSNVSHYRRRLYKHLGGTPRNNLILKNSHPIVQEKNSKKRKLIETSNSIQKLASPSTTAPKYATFNPNPPKSTNNQSSLSFNFTTNRNLG